jgi:NAD(P)-dependent dehydrogenase (short-subunit alcohol dehydrogenase family)
VIDRLDSKTALVTGGTDGVGKEIVCSLAKLGASAEREIRALSSNSDVEFIRADLSLMQEAARLADLVATRLRSVHYLVHSAGVIRGHNVATAEGFESNFATNYLSRFALTTELLPSIQSGGRPGKSARIVFISHPGSNGPIEEGERLWVLSEALVRSASGPTANAPLNSR